MRVDDESFPTFAERRPSLESGPRTLRRVEMPTPESVQPASSSNGAAVNPPIREWLVLLVLAAVQFTAIVDFMVIMPLAPELEKALGLTPAKFGLVVASYTYAAGLAGLLATMFIDHFPRRRAFLWLFAGFLAGTFACGLAPSYEALLFARFLTGAFGGILGGMAMTIVGDVFPEARRGAATGALMSAFALASTFGVPIGITLGQNYGWHWPFFALAILGAPVLILARVGLPPLDAHVGSMPAEAAGRRLWSTLSEPNHVRAFGLTTLMQLGGFAVVPFVAPFFVANVGVPKDRLWILYSIGGVMTLLTSPVFGKMADRYGKLRMYRILAPVAALVMLGITNLGTSPFYLAAIAMAGLMVFNAGRMVPAWAMITSSVEPHRRGGFLGANTAVQHMASGLGVSLGGAILAKPGEQYLHFPIVGLISAGVTLVSLWIAGRLRVANESRPITIEAAIAAAAQGEVDQAEPLLEAS
jgi:DHA1 family inner membrane transport protein